MKDKTFRRLLAAVMIVGSVSSFILVLVTIHMYQNCSILSYIANGR